MNFLRIKNNGIIFSARLVVENDFYGSNFSTQHLEKEPIIEFFDARFKDPNYQLDGVYLGQFISRYDLSTFNTIKTGVFLCSGASEWSLNPENVQIVQEWAKNYLEQKNQISLGDNSKKIGSVKLG